MEEVKIHYILVLNFFKKKFFYLFDLSITFTQYSIF